MIVGKEGQPRSGKSYETVKFDILEALKVGRRVFARINGLDHAKIAMHLDKSLEEVRSLLYVMRDDEVLSMLVCETQPDGSLVFPHLETGALVVVDEVHEYWPTGRQPLQQLNEDFFAKHGHISLDVVVMSQDFKEVHRSIVRRLQRKNLYVKLDALGKDSSYSVRFYTAPSAGKFELMGSEKRDYDPVIWPLYHGVQPGVESNTVYKTGSRTLWQTAKWPAIGVGLALVIGIGMLVRFFGGSGMVPEASVRPANQGDPPGVYPVRSVELPAPSAVPVGVPVVVVPEKVEAPGIAYVLDLIKTTRPRYAGSVGGRHIVEFRAIGGGQVMERLTSEQMQALGWGMVAKPFGALATAGDHVIVFTAWPTDPLYQQSEQTARDIRGAGPPVTSASESRPGPASSSAGVIGSAQVNGYGDIGVGVNP